MSAALVDRFFSAVSDGDMNTVRSLYNDKCVSTDYASGKVSTGIEENLQDVNQWRSAFSNMKVEAISHVETANTVVTEMKFVGTNDGAMPAPDGTSIPATGKTVTMQGCQICEFEEGKMVNTRQYYDMMGMMAQLGLMPSE